MLGDGAHPAQALGADHPRGRQRPADARHDRQAGRRGVPGARTLQRAGRPHHGHLGEDARAASSTRWTRSSASPPARARVRHRRRASARCATAGARCSSAWAATSSRATPDTEVTEAALRSCSLTVQVSTKLNRSPRGPRADGADPADAGPHRASTCRRAASSSSPSRTRCRMVHASRGRLRPASRRSCCRRWPSSAGWPAPCSAPTTPCRGRSSRPTTTPIRDPIARVVPGCEDYNAKVRRPDGFVLPHPPRDSREFPTATGKANFTVNPSWYLQVPQGRLLLQTLRSHDQYNTTIYGLSTTVTAASRAGGVWCSSTPTTSPSSACGTGSASTWSASGRTRRHDHGAAGRRFPHRRLSARRGAVPPPTTRRPTRWCRWIPLPMFRTPRPRSRWWFASNRGGNR